MEQRGRPVPSETWEWVRDQNIWRYRSRLNSLIGDEESVLVRQLLAEELDKTKGADGPLKRAIAWAGTNGGRDSSAAQVTEKSREASTRAPLATRIKALYGTARHLWRPAKAE